MTEIRSDLIGMLKSIGLNEDSTVGIVQLAETDENRLKLLQMMSDYYMERGSISEETVGKMLLMLIGSKKNSDSDS